MTPVNQFLFRGTLGDGSQTVGFLCPGCGECHGVPITGPLRKTFNGSFMSPTFTGTLTFTTSRFFCSITLSAGTFTFNLTTTNPLAGKTSPLVAFVGPF